MVSSSIDYKVESTDDVDSSCNMIQVRRRLGGIREFIYLIRVYCSGTSGPSEAKREIVFRCLFSGRRVLWFFLLYFHPIRS